LQSALEKKQRLCQDVFSLSPRYIGLKIQKVF